MRTAVFALALAVRLLYLFDGADSPAFDTPLVDADTYHRWAQQLAGGGAPGEELFWQPVFYPFFLAAIYGLTDSSLIAAKLVQALLGATTCVLTFKLGSEVVDRRAGALAGFFVALYGPWIFFDLELLSTGWDCFWSVLLLHLVLAASRRGGRALSLVLGVSGGLAVATRPTFLPFCLAAAVALGAVWRSRRGGRAAAARLGLLAAGLGLVLLPLAAASAKYAGRFSILPASSGINLYIGNNPDAAATQTIRPGWEWSELTRLPEQHGVEHRRDTSAFFRDRFLDYVRSEPLGFLAGLAGKAAQLVSSRELPRNVDVYVMREWSATLGVLVWKIGAFGFPFGVLLPLALLGAFDLGRRVPWPMPLFLLLYGGSIVLVFVSDRYRAPLIAPLAVLAAAGALGLLDALRNRNLKRVAAASIFLPLCGVLMSLAGPFPQERIDYKAELSYLVGTSARQKGELDRAEALLGEAIERVPSHSDALNQLGNLSAMRNRTDLALEYYRRATESAPRNAVARDNYARFLLRSGRHAEAVEQFEEALRMRPRSAKLHHFMSAALLAQGRYEEAIEHGLRAIELDPRDADAQTGLIRAVDGLGRTAEATAQIRAALERARAAGAKDAAGLLEERLHQRGG